VRFSLRKFESARGLAVGAAAVALLLLGFTPWPMQQSAIEQQLTTQFQAAGGTTLDIAGPVSFTMLPLPHVSVQRVTMNYRDGAVLAQATRATIGLDGLALLTGRIVPRNALFSGLDAQAAGRPGASPLDTLRRLFEEAHVGQALPGIAWIAVRDGRLRLGASPRGRETLDKFGATWSADGAAGSFGLTLNGQWRGEALRITMTAPSNLAPSQANSVAARLEVDTRLLTLTFDGQVLGGGEPKAVGRLRANSPDGLALADWLGIPPPFPGRLDQFGIGGDLAATWQQLALSNAQLSLNGDRYDGVIGLRLNGRRPSISATLNTDKADLTGQFKFLAPRRDAGGGWSSERYNVKALHAAHVDLRLSARRLVLSGLALDNAAISLLLDDRRFEISLAEAALAGGMAKGRLVITPNPAGVELRGQATISAADIGAILNKNFAINRLNGQLSMTVGLESSGDSTAALIDNLAGSAKASIANGKLIGVDLDRFMLRLERRSLFSALDVPAGETQFDEMVLDASVKAGNLEIGTCSFTSPTLKVSLNGLTEAPTRRLDFSGAIASNERNGRAPAALPFTIRGSWAAPKISPQLSEFRRL
jgi:AsmA protein